MIVVEPPAYANGSTFSGQATLSTTVSRIYWMLVRIHGFVCREHAKNNRKEH